MFADKCVIDRKNKVIMAWSAKAGCTVAIKMFFDHMGLLQDALKREPSDPLGIHTYFNETFVKNGVPSIEEFNNKTYFKFQIVRNPYTRVVSSYIHAINKHLFSGSFVNFLEMLSNTDLTDCNEHWQLQCRYDPLVFNKIVKLENFKSDINEVNREIGTKFKTDFTAGHHLIKTDVKEFFGHYIFIQEVRKICNYKNFYNDLIFIKVSKLYEDDIRVYKYDRIDNI